MAYPTEVIRQDHEAIQRARVDLAAAHRLANLLGYDDGIWNHFTLSVPGAPDRFLVKAHGLLMSEVTASNLIVVDAEGTVVEGNGTVEATAFCIHSKIHELHPRAPCVLHAHPPNCTWLADIRDGRLEMIDQDCLRFYERVAYDDDYCGIASKLAEGERIAGAMGDKPILLSRNHGVTTTGATVAEAFTDLHYMEQACGRQYRVHVSGCEPAMVSDAVLKSFAGRHDDDSNRTVGPALLYFEAMKRSLDERSPSYRI